MSALERGFHTQDEVQDAQRAEDKALDAVWSHVEGTDGDLEGGLEAYVEAVRRTERLRAEALVAMSQEIWHWANSTHSTYSSPAELVREADMWQRLGATLAAYRESQS